MEQNVEKEFIALEQDYGLIRCFAVKASEQEFNAENPHKKPGQQIHTWNPSAAKAKTDPRALCLPSLA